MTQNLETTDPNPQILSAATPEQRQKHDQLHDLMDGCTGSEHMHRVTFSNWFFVTDGILEMVKSAAAYWFCDVVMSHTPAIAKRDNFATIELTVQSDQSAEFIAHDGREPRTLYAQQKIPFTTFPVGAWRFFLSQTENESGQPVWILMQTSEY
jgi:hypothetical protein